MYLICLRHGYDMLCVCGCGHTLEEVRGQPRVLSSPASLFQVGTWALLAEYTKRANPRDSGILLSMSPILSREHQDYRHITESLIHALARFELRSSFLLKGCFAH